LLRLAAGPGPRHDDHRRPRELVRPADRRPPRARIPARGSPHRPRRRPAADPGAAGPDHVLVRRRFLQRDDPERSGAVRTRDRPPGRRERSRRGEGGLVHGGARAHPGHLRRRRGESAVRRESAMSRCTWIVLAAVGIVLFAAPARAQFVDGDLYVSDSVNNKIYRVQPGTWTVTTFVDTNAGLSLPNATLLTPAGTLLCSSYYNDKVFEFDSAGNGSVLYDGTSGLVGPFGENGLALDVNGGLYV